MSERNDIDTRFSLLDLDIPGRPNRDPEPTPEPQRPALAPSPMFARPAAVSQNPLGLTPAEMQGAANRQPQPAQPVPSESPRLSGDNMVAGSVAAGHGALVGWLGNGELNRGVIIAALDRANCPTEWAPKPKSYRAHAGKAVQNLNNHGYIARADRKAQLDESGKRQTAKKGQHRWIVGRANVNGDLDENFGQVIAIVELHGETLHTRGSHSVCEAVTVEYRRTLESEVLTAGEVTQWLKSVMRGRFGAIQMGGIYYVPAQHVEMANRLCVEMGRDWGCGWIVPALPVATGDELRAGLAKGLESEVNELSDRFETEMETAKASGRAQLGPRAAQSYYSRLNDIVAKCRSYSDVLGQAHVAAVQATANAFLDQVRDLCHDTALRGEMLEFD